MARFRRGAPRGRPPAAHPEAAGCVPSSRGSRSPTAPTGVARLAEGDPPVIPRRFRRAAATLAAGLILSLFDHDQAAATDLAALGPQFRDVVERTLRQCQVPGASVGVFSGDR